MATEEQLNELYDRFLGTDEAREWDEFVQHVREALETAGNVMFFPVPAGFLRRAIDQIGTDPLMFRHMVDVYNRIADEMDLPEEQKKY
jgi:hypothetical protein